MSDWEPATEAEAAMLAALAASDQEHYFRLLSRTDLLLPVSDDAIAGRVPMGWGTWTTGNRTHVLAFTSGPALFACLSEHIGSYRKLSFRDLGAQWPNYEWWLAVNPGLPIEAYLPSWFVSQLTRGDVRLPGRSMGARARMAQSELAAALSGRVRASAPAPTPSSATSVPTTPSRTSIPPIVTTAGPHPGGGQQPVIETVEAEIIDSPTPGSSVGPAGSVAASARVSSASRHTLDASWVDPAGAATLGSRGAGGPSVQEPEDAEVIAAPVAPGRAGGPAGDGPAGSGRAGGPAAGGGAPGGAAAGGVDGGAAGGAWAAVFAPANETEANLLAAVQENNTDAFLSTLLLARVIVPVPPGTPASARPGDLSFPWLRDQVDNQEYLSVFTSPERLAEHGFSRYGPNVSSVSTRFVALIRAWPDEAVAFAINPGSPIGATLPGSQIVALANWAADVGLRADPPAEVAVAARPSESATGVAGAPSVGAGQATVMQRVVPPEQVPYYLERGYDRVSGFVHRASEVAHLTSPRSLYRALGLAYAGSPFSDDDAEVHVLRWVAHRSDLYRIPYGGQHEAGMRAMQGWVIERPPFRGNGFAPGETSDVIAEFKVDSVRLPHGARMWRLAKDGIEVLVATYDADLTRWVRTEPVFGPGGLTGAGRA